ncbi:ComEC/Rec2 family competence protein [uncultured Sunxiuqinia sp.]|uniref:ComEC/Rec2 family competence protein n=1 Tax=uncultured Sunxiuqinia sp. TaxID=1573825 RepID=UPI0030DC3304
MIPALTSGHRKELSPETRSHFASTGAMHVLAVFQTTCGHVLTLSGLHVGMICLFLTTLFGLLKRSPNGRICFVLIIGTLLLRASDRPFSFFASENCDGFFYFDWCQLKKRPAAIYNAIAALAFFLLLLNPRLLSEVGFQLSYAAFISIVFFYPRFVRNRHTASQPLF